MNSCCFIGHREIDETEELKLNIWKTVENLIINENIDTFFFGSKSRFNSLCLEIVTEIKQKYPHIKRVQVRDQYPHIEDWYKNYLLTFYDETYYPENIKGSKGVYVERNYEMIKNSRFCIFYYDEAKAPKTRKSGTKIALDFAFQMKKEIISLAENLK